MERADKADSIRWWDALDAITGEGVTRDIALALQMARGSHHRDAQWLCSVLPATEKEVTEHEMLAAMLEQGEDPRALYVRAVLGDGVDLLQRAAELGYAPAQASWGGEEEWRDALEWMEKAAAQGSRAGLTGLAHMMFYGREERERDVARALALWKEAGELGDQVALHQLGLFGFKPTDRERYQLWGRAAARGNLAAICDLQMAASLQEVICGVLGGREVIEFELGAALKGRFNAERKEAFGASIDDEKLAAIQRCVELYDTWCAAAKTAIECWIAVGRRLEVVRDIRVLIARRLWEERSAWCVRREEESK